VKITKSRPIGFEPVISHWAIKEKEGGEEMEQSWSLEEEY